MGEARLALGLAMTGEEEQGQDSPDAVILLLEGGKAGPKRGCCNAYAMYSCSVMSHLFTHWGIQPMERESLCGETGTAFEF